MGKLQKATKSNITQAKSKAKQPPMPYLEEVFALMRIVYYALDALEMLPPPWDVPKNAQIESKTLASLEKMTDKECLRKRREEKKHKREEGKATKKPISSRTPRSKKSMEIQLNNALKENVETQQALQATLLENLKNVARAQMDLDFVDLHTRVLHRQKEELRKKNQVLVADLDASISLFNVTNKEYHRFEELS